MSGSIHRLYQQIHFQMNELILFYNYPELSEEVKDHLPCNHIDKLRCSKADEYSSEDCITVRKCELYHNKTRLFFEAGIDIVQLQILDEELKSNT